MALCVVAVGLHGTPVFAAEDPPTAVPEAPPQTVWAEQVRKDEAAYAERRLAILKVADALYLEEGQTAVLSVAHAPAQGLQWSIVGDADPDRALLAVTWRDGHATLDRGGERLDLLAMHTELPRYPVSDRFDLKAQVTQIRPGVEGLRLTLFDQEHPAAKGFGGLDYFGYDPSFAVEARFEPAGRLEAKVFQTSRGWYKQFYLAGEAVFDLGGRELRLPLYAAENDPSAVTVMSAFFTDRLTGSQTYGVGRYLDVSGFGTFPPETVPIDFNYAYNPLCARSPHYNCPVAVDDLPVAVTAGEKAPRAAAH
jgi:uncharacterized protein (DUF1684 family)